MVILIKLFISQKKKKTGPEKNTEAGTYKA